MTCPTMHEAGLNLPCPKPLRPGQTRCVGQRCPHWQRLPDLTVRVHEDEQVPDGCIAAGLGRKGVVGEGWRRYGRFERGWCALQPEPTPDVPLPGKP